MGVLNDGGLTLVAPRYANLFHGILYQIVLSCNAQKMVENRNECMAIARLPVMNQVPGWAVKLEVLTAGLLLSKPKEACTTQILTEIITKTFNAKGNSIMKRYYSCFLARGGKKSALSSNRESRKKHEGLAAGRKKTTPTPQPPSR